jgi:hypothetical protein
MEIKYNGLHLPIQDEIYGKALCEPFATQFLRESITKSIIEHMKKVRCPLLFKL